MSDREEKSEAYDDAELERRRGMTFKQAEGIDPLPRQLKFKELDQKFRSVLWATLLSHIDVIEGDYISSTSDKLGHRWRQILYHWHVLEECKPSDDFTSDLEHWKRRLKPLIWQGDYGDVFQFLQFVVRSESCAPATVAVVADLLERSQSPYRLVEKTIVPIASAQEAETISRAIQVTADLKQPGANEHLKKAASELTTGNYAASIRESIHAVESAARVLAPGTKSLSNALTELTKVTPIHGGMKRGFEALYGFTSDNNGIRHPLLEKGAAQVDEADALFMLGACASFVTYLLAKTRN